MLLGDIGETARLAGRGELNQAKLSPFRPIKCMLASPETTAEAIWKRFTDAPALNALAINTDRPTISPELSRAGRQENYSALMPAACAPTGPTVYVEDKFDGIRAQLHRTVMRVEIYSRDLRRITDQLPELAEQARSLSSDLILDGEIMAFEHGKKLTFFDLQKRLGRKDEGADLFAIASANVPVVFIVFDLLWFHGQSLLKMPQIGRASCRERV